MQEDKDALLDYVTWAIYVNAKEAGEELGISGQEAEAALMQMAQEGILVKAQGRDGYRLKI